MQLADVLNRYVAFISQRRSPGTVRIRSACFRPFLKVHGAVPADRLTHAMAYEFCTSDGSARFLMQSLSAALRWAMRSGIIDKNPMVGIELPPSRSRGREAVLTQDQHENIVSSLDNYYGLALRDFIIALENTGARPSEIADAEAANLSADGAIVYHGKARLLRGEKAHKTSRRDKERVILLTGEALELAKRLVKRHPKGPLWRTRCGTRWTKHGWGNSFRALARRLRLPHLTAYSYRHTFATRWLLAGGSVEVLAELMGNTPATIHKHYAHLCCDRQGLRAKLEAFRQSEPS